MYQNKMNLYVLL